MSRHERTSRWIGLAAGLTLFHPASAAPPATPTPVLASATPAPGSAVGLSSYASRAKVDRGRADTLFRQDGAPPPATPAPEDRPPSGGSRRSANRPEPQPAAASAQEEAGWRARASTARQSLETARAELAAADGRLPREAASSVGTPQRDLLLSRYRARVDRAQAAVDAVAEECRRSPSCQPGWVR